MVVWHRKGVGITDSAGAVSLWTDQTANGHHYTQATGANQPTKQGSGTILFDGTSDFLETAAFTLNQPYTRYIRFRQVTWTAFDYVCDGLIANTGVIFQYGSSPDLDIYAGIHAAQNSAMPIGTWKSVGAVFNGASSMLNIGGSTASGDAGASSISGLRLAASGGSASAFANIEVAEEIIYSVAHTALQQAEVIAYLDTL
jgi:hypothetical protein